MSLTDSSDAPGVPATNPVVSVREFRRYALAVSLIGITLQLLLSLYYLSVGRAPQPHDLPVGVVGAQEQQEQLKTRLEADGAFSVTGYSSADELTAAIRRKDAYGGVDLSASPPRLFVATAAGPAASTLLQNTFTTALRERAAAQVAALAAQSATVPASAVAALTSPPAITDVVPLPAEDRGGGSIGFLVQALVLGGTIASTGLGKLIPRTRRSTKRGLGHVATLLVYAMGSAAAVLCVLNWFGIGTSADSPTLYLDFVLLSLAITASTAGFVALIGPLGSVIGLGYFALGTVISGASLLPEFLPTAGRVVGQLLPTGAGVSAIRDGLYFPDADTSGPHLVLALYAGIGILVVLLTNLVANNTGRKAQLANPVVDFLTGTTGHVADPPDAPARTEKTPES